MYDLAVHSLYTVYTLLVELDRAIYATVTHKRIDKCALLKK